MLTIIRAKNTNSLGADIGQYNIATHKLQIWVNSTRLMNGATEMVIPNFDFPEDTEKVELIDEGTDQVLAVPLNTFKEAKRGDGIYVFEFADWLKKYRRLP